MELSLPLVFEILGLAAFATSGALAAFKKDLDIVGFVFVATFTGIGGGTIRDVILNRNVFWLHDAYLYSLNICIACAVLTYIVSRFIQKRENIVNWFDAAGLALFSVQGYMISQSVVNSGEVAVVMGLFTGCGGGLLRDIALNRRPFIFRGELYATNSIIGLLFLHFTNKPVLAFLIIFALRAATIKYKWSLK